MTLSHFERTLRACDAVRRWFETHLCAATLDVLREAAPGAGLAPDSRAAERPARALDAMLRDHVFAPGGTLAAFYHALVRYVPSGVAGYTRHANASESEDGPVMRRLLNAALRCGLRGNVPFMATLMERAQLRASWHLCRLNWLEWVRALLAHCADAALLHLCERHLAPSTGSWWDARWKGAESVPHGCWGMVEARMELLLVYAARAPSPHALRMVAALMRDGSCRRFSEDVWLAALANNRAHVLQRLVQTVAWPALSDARLYFTLETGWRQLAERHERDAARAALPMDAVRYLLVDSVPHDDGKTRAVARIAFERATRGPHRRACARLYETLRDALPSGTLP